MAGYTRQSIADIIPGATVRSGPINNEYNQLEAAMAALTGHAHDGSTGEGAYVPLIADADALNKVVVDTATNTVTFYTEVGGVATAQLVVQDGKIVPQTDNDIDLGSTTKYFKDAYLKGTLKVAVVSSGTITPQADDTYDLGSSSLEWRNLYVDGTASIDSLVADTADINAGTIDNTVIGATTPVAITGTAINSTAGFTGDLTGDVTGDVTGNLTGNVTGNIASSGTSTFNAVTITGSLDMDAGTTATITNLSTPVLDADAATKGYVDTSIANVIDAAPAALDTLNELAAALGDDADFAGTVTTNLATKLNKAGDTMTGTLDMGANKITTTYTPVNSADLINKSFADTTYINASGDTMTGALNMGANTVSSTATPTADDHLTRKGYIDALYGSTASAATSASAAAASAAAALISENAADSRATDAAASAAAAAASYDSFDDRFLGSKASAPTTDNDGDALLTGAIYWNSTSNSLFIWDGSAWTAAVFDVNNALFAEDIGVTVQGYDPDTAKYDDSTANFTGTLQNGGSDVLVDSDIGTTVQAYDATILTNSDIGTSVLSPTGDGSGLTGIETNPTVTTFTASPNEGDRVYVPYGSTITDMPVVSVFKDSPAEEFTATEYVLDSATATYDDTVLDIVDGDLQFKITGSTPYSPAVLVASTDLSTLLPNASIRGIDFNSDGTKAIVTDSDNDKLHSLSLSVAWDLASASLVGSRSTIGSVVQGLSVSPNGLYVYYVDTVSRYIYSHRMATAWDVTTVDYSWSYYVSSYEYYPTGVFVKEDGTKLYVSGYSGDDVNEFNLTTPYDLSTISYVGVSSSGTNATNGGLHISSDGTKVFTLSNSVISLRTLSIAWDITSASSPVNAGIANVYPMSITRDGTKLFYTNARTVTYYSINLYSYTANTPSVAISPNVITSYWNNADIIPKFETNGEVIDFAFNVDNGAWSVSNSAGVRPIVRNNAGTWEYNSNQPNFDALSATTADKIQQGYYTQNIRTICVSSDGLKFFGVNTSNQLVWFAMSTAFDFSTCIYQTYQNLSMQHTYASFVNPAEDEFTLVSSTGQILKSGFNSYFYYGTDMAVESTTIPDMATGNLYEVRLDSNGTKAFILYGSGIIRAYTLSTAWDITTASYDSVEYNAKAEATSMLGYAGMEVSADGKRIYIVDESDRIYQFNLSTAWDLSTASYEGNATYSTLGFEANAYNIEFMDDYEKLLISSANRSPHIFNALSEGTDTEWVSASTNTEAAALEQSVTNKFNKLTAGVNVGSSDFDMLVDNGDRLSISLRYFSYKMSPDGVYFVVIDNGGANGYTYEMSTPYDITTATLLSSKAWGATMFAFGIDPTGTKGILVDNAGVLYSCTLSTAWDVSSVTYTSASIDVTTDVPSSIAFNADGTRAIIGVASSNAVEIVLPTPYQAENATTVATSIGSNPYTVSYNDDYTKLYASNANSTLTEYALTTAGNASTASATGRTWNLDTIFGNDTWYSVDFIKNGTQAVITGANTHYLVDVGAAISLDSQVLGDQLKLAVIMETTDVNTTPTYDSAVIAVDTASLVKEAVVGTDYEVTQQDTGVIIKFNEANNFKGRIV